MKPKQEGPLKNQIRRLRFEHGEMTQQCWPTWSA